MTQDIIVKNYSEALLNSASGNLKEIHKEVTALSDLFEENEELWSFFSSPVTTEDKKKQLLELLFHKNKFTKEIQNFLYLLVKNKRLELFLDISYYFQDNILLSNNISTAIVTSSQKLTESEKKEVAEMLEEKFGTKFEITTNEDPNILGGLVIKYGSMLIDLSLNGQLKQIEEISKKKLETLQGSL